MLTTIALLIVCAILAVAGVPLMLRLVPRNEIYGVRTEYALSRDERWFEVNAFGGRALVIAAAVCALLIVLYSGTWLRPWWAQVLVLLASVGAAAGATFAFERRLKAGRVRAPVRGRERK